MVQELYKKHRPTKLTEMYGQDDALASLKEMVKSGNVPHAILFTGPSGCGKTTLARMLAARLKCSKTDFFEYNSADFRGIEHVREIRTKVGMAPISSPCRIWLLDESHQLTSDAQTAMLKLLEDTPEHVYFMLATTDPNKLKKTIRTRCTEVKLKALTDSACGKLVTAIAKKEKKTVGKEAVKAIVESAEGSARKALVLLNAVIEIDNEDEQAKAVHDCDTRAEGIQLCRALFAPKPSWSKVSEVLRNLEGDPESIRWLVLGYARSVLLSPKTTKNDSRAYEVISSFSKPFFDTKNAGLAASCYEVFDG